MSILFLDGLMLNLAWDEDWQHYNVRVSLFGHIAAKGGFSSTSRAYKWAEAQVNRIIKDAAA